MAGETEIERMIVRLMGDSSNYQKMIDDAVKQGQQLERANAQITESERKRQAMMQQGAAVTRSVMTDTERYNVRLDEMSVLLQKGAISRQTFDRVMKQSENLLPEFAESAKKQAEAESHRQSVMSRGANLTQSMLSAEERHKQTVGELGEMLKAGAISQDTHNRAVDQANQQYQSASGSVAVLTQRMSNLGSGLLQAGSAITAVGALIAGSLGFMGNQAISSAKSFEQTMVAYGAMLGSQDKAQKLLGELTELGAKTPFEMPTLLSATRMLLQFQVPAKEVVGILKSIGDVTGGSDPGKVQSMAYAFSQMSAAGRLMGQDLMQMINAGFNPLTEMAKKTGKSLQTLRQEMGEGKITADMVKEAFASASGRLNLMEKQSATLEGRISTLNDNIGILMRSLGNALLPIAGFFVDIKATIVGFFNSLSDETKKYIAYAGLFTFAVGAGIAAVGGMAIAVGGLVLTFAGVVAALDALEVRMVAYTAQTVAATGGTTTLSASLVGYVSSLSLSSIVTGGFNTILSLLSVRTWASVAAFIASKTAQLGYVVATKTAAMVTGIATAAIGLYRTVLTATTGISILATIKSLALGAARIFEAAMTTLATAATWMYVAAATAGLALLVVVAGAVYLLAKAWWDYNEAITKGAGLTQELIDIQKKQTASDIGAGKQLQTVDEQKDYFETLIKQAKQSEDQLQDSVEQLKRNKRDGFFTPDDANVLKDTEQMLKAAKDRVEELDLALTESQGMGAIKKELEATMTLIDSYQGKLDSANQTIRELGNAPNLTEGQQKALDEARAAVDKYTKSLDNAKDRADTLTKASTLKTTNELEEAIKNVNKELAAIGKTPAQVVAETALSQGASPEKVKEFTQKSAHAEAAKAQDDVRKSLVAMNADLAKQQGLWQFIGDQANMTQAEIKLAELQYQATLVGTTEEMDKQIAKAQELVAASKEHDRVKMVRDFNQALTDQIAMLGLTAQQAELYKLKIKGATEAEILHTQTLQNQLKAGQMNVSIDEMIKKLNEQAATFGMTAEAAELYRLKIAGATDEQIKAVKAAQEQLKTLEKNKALKDAGKELTLKYDTKAQKSDLLQKKLELKEMWESGAISTDVYKKALKDVQDQAKKTGQDIQGMTQTVEGAFTAEHITRVEKYFQNLNSQHPKNEVNRQIADVGALTKTKDIYAGVKPDMNAKNDQMMAFMERFNSVILTC